MTFSLDLLQPEQYDGSLESIQKTHTRVSISGIHQLINLWYQEGIFQACSVQVGKVHSYPPFTVLLLHYHGIGQPFQEKNFFYRPHFFQLLHFLLYNFNMLLSQPPQFLLFRWVQWVYVKSLDYKFWIHRRHLKWTLSKNVKILNWKQQHFHSLLMLYTCSYLEFFIFIWQYTYLNKILSTVHPLFPMGFM